MELYPQVLVLLLHSGYTYSIVWLSLKMYKKHLSNVNEDSTESSSRGRLSDMDTADIGGSSAKKTELMSMLFITVAKTGPRGGNVCNVLKNNK